MRGLSQERQAVMVSYDNARSQRWQGERGKLHEVRATGRLFTRFCETDVACNLSIFTRPHHNH